jgi:hypothetical protein
VCIFELRHVCRKEIKAKMGFWRMKTRNLILIQRREGTFGEDHLILNVTGAAPLLGNLIFYLILSAYLSPHVTLRRHPSLKLLMKNKFLFAQLEPLKKV